MIRVCPVEDQTLVRQGIQTLLDLVDDIDVVAEAKDGDEALRVIPQSKPDVVLLDMYLLRLPDQRRRNTNASDVLCVSPKSIRQRNNVISHTRKFLRMLF